MQEAADSGALVAADVMPALAAGTMAADAMRACTAGFCGGGTEGYGQNEDGKRGEGFGQDRSPTVWALR